MKIMHERRNSLQIMHEYCNSLQIMHECSISLQIMHECSNFFQIMHKCSNFNHLIQCLIHRAYKIHQDVQKLRQFFWLTFTPNFFSIFISRNI